MNLILITRLICITEQNDGVNWQIYEEGSLPRKVTCFHGRTPNLKLRAQCLKVQGQITSSNPWTVDLGTWWPNRGLPCKASCPDEYPIFHSQQRWKVASRCHKMEYSFEQEAFHRKEQDSPTMKGKQEDMTVLIRRMMWFWWTEEDADGLLHLYAWISHLPSVEEK